MKATMYALILTVTLVTTDTITMTQTVYNDGSYAQGFTRSSSSTLDQPTFWDYVMDMMRMGI